MFKLPDIILEGFMLEEAPVTKLSRWKDDTEGYPNYIEFFGEFFLINHQKYIHGSNVSVGAKIGERIRPSKSKLVKIVGSLLNWGLF